MKIGSKIEFLLVLCCLCTLTLANDSIAKRLRDTTIAIPFTELSFTIPAPIEFFLGFAFGATIDAMTEFYP